MAFSHGENFEPWYLRVCIGAETTLVNWCVSTTSPQAGLRDFGENDKITYH